MKFVIAHIVARHCEPAAEAETRIARSIAAVRLDAGITIREKRVADAPGVDDIGAGAKRLDNARPDKQRIAESNRASDVVVARAVGGEQIVRSEFV